MSVAILGLQLDRTTGRAQAPSSSSDWTLSSSRGAVALTGSREILEGSQVFGPAQRSALTVGALGIDGLAVNARRAWRRAERRLSFIVHVEGDSAVQRAQLMRQLLAVLTPLDPAGSPYVTVTVRIESGEQVEIQGIAEFSGSDYGPIASWDDVAVVSFDVLCPDPLWRGRTRTITQRAATGGGSFFPILPFALAPSTSIGDPVVIDVAGDGLAYPVHVVSGPVTSVRCESSRGPAWEVDLTAAPLLAGQVLTVETDPRTVFLGRPRVQGPAGQDYTQYLVERSLFALLPDTETITYEVAGSSASTSVELRWRPGVEGVL